MAKRKSESARVVEFFRSAPTEVASAVFGIIQGELKARLPKAKPPVKRKLAFEPILAKEA